MTDKTHTERRTASGYVVVPTAPCFDDGTEALCLDPYLPNSRHLCDDCLGDGRRAVLAEAVTVRLTYGPGMWIEVDR